MIFIRYIFLIFTLISCTSVGFLLSKRYSDRTKELKSLSNLINILQNKIKFTHKPLGEIFEEISNVQENIEISKIFSKTGQRLEKQKIEDAWNETITEQRIFLNFKDEDIELMKSLGNVLGKTDIDGQMSEINQFKVLLESSIKNSEEEKAKNSKMYKSLGAIIGLAIVIILF